MMVAFVLGEVAAYQMGMTVWFIIAAALFLFHRKLCPMKHKAHSFSPAVIKTAEGRVDSDFQTDAERVWNWKDPMMCRVFLLFFCFLAGWGRMTVEMRPDALERMVTQKGGSAEVAVSGTLDSISEKNGWCTMILTGVEVEDESVKKAAIGFQADLKDKYDNDKNLLNKVTVEDLRMFGMVPEFLGRLPIIFTLQGLDEDMLVKILKEPRNAILKQYEKLLEMDEVKLEFEENALRAIAKKALEKDTGARALRAILEEYMLDIMYEIPKDDSIGEVIITKEYIEHTGGPKILLRGQEPLLLQ